MKKLLSLLAAVGVLFYLSSCSDDDDGGDPNPTFDDPVVTAGSVSDIPNGGTGTVSFTVVLDDEITEEADWEATTDGDITLGETSGTTNGGNVIIDVTAGITPGAASVTLTVTDSEGGVDDATAVFNILAADDNVVTLMGIPESGLISDGDDVVLTDIGLEAVDGLATFEAAVNDGDPIDLIVLSDDLTVGATDSIVFSLTLTKSQLGYEVRDDNSITFTATDNNGSSVSVEHTLQVAPAVGGYASTVTTDRSNPAVEVSGKISGTVDWDADTVYILTGRLIVGSGATLNIPEGTVIKAEEGSGVNAKALMVASGGTLNADGSDTNPIIMTSILDDISAADVAGGTFLGSLEPDVSGLWGGLIILGDAPISASAESVQIEGIPTSVAEGLYGGDNEGHNAGTITYVSVRHGGSNIGDGNEINGITLGGVGSGTTIENVEIVANQDDGIEWFGGNVNISNALIWNSGDDSMDTDQDWQGSMDGFIIITPDGSAFELDGPEGPDARDGGAHQFMHGTVYAGSDIAFLVDWDSETNAGLQDIYWFGIEPDYNSDGELGIASFEGDGSGTTLNWQTDVATEDIATYFGDAADIVTSTTANTVGPDGTNFGWTFAGAYGALSDIGL